MVVASPTHDCSGELQEFDDVPITSVKELVDAGIQTVPMIFHYDLDDEKTTSSGTNVGIPIIDMDGAMTNPVKRKEIVDKIRDASETLGFFQVINHGISDAVMEEMIEGSMRFFDQDLELKKPWFVSDPNKKVVYNNHLHLDVYKSPQSFPWKDSLRTMMMPNPAPLEEIPAPCREILVEYSEDAMKLGLLIMELLSEGLGLPPNYLKEIGCGDGFSVLINYYPSCPQPEKTLGTRKHSDVDFLTVLLQNDDRLQYLIDDKWIDVPYVPGAMVINIGDFIQMITNDKFKSKEHRALAKLKGPRVSVAGFFSTYMEKSSRVFEPIKELLSEDNPPKYKEITVKDYTACLVAHALDSKAARQQFRL